MSKVLVVRCQENGCLRPATWKLGTWWFCEEHYKSYMFEEPAWPGYDSVWGSAYRCGMVKGEDYWITEVPKDMCVEIDEECLTQ